MITKANQTEPGAPRRLARLVEGRTSGGIAAELTAFFALELTHVRLVFVVLALVSGAGLPLCLAVWALIPEEGSGTAHGRWLLRPATGRSS
jgi:phage shock protein PspC (stress-responsive transcriptional regulator)